MIPKLDILRRITDAGLVAVVRAESGDQVALSLPIIAGSLMTRGCWLLPSGFIT